MPNASPQQQGISCSGRNPACYVTLDRLYDSDKLIMACILGRDIHMVETEANKKREFEFFLDAAKHQTENKYLSGEQIKGTGNVDPSYQLFLEEEGDTPDKAISDSETVDLGGKIKHFYAVPPATFGV
jgi:hypothetical protein